MVLSEGHLIWLVRFYISYYHEDRCHLGLNKDTPKERPITPRPPSAAKVVAIPREGGLHHRYEWREAADPTRVFSAAQLNRMRVVAFPVIQTQAKKLLIWCFAGPVSGRDATLAVSGTRSRLACRSGSAKPLSALTGTRLPPK